MPWIQNVSAKQVEFAWHIDAGPNSMLIQIMDPPGDFPISKHQFKETHQFEFLDIEEDCLEFSITNEQAKDIAKLLQKALSNKMNVIVHCFAGVCRSGAVAEVGVILGFSDTETHRSPNILVKHKLLKALNMPFDPDEKSDPESWRKYKFID